MHKMLCILEFTWQQHFAEYKNPSKLKLTRGDYNQLREFLNVKLDDFLKAPYNSVDDMWEI